MLAEDRDVYMQRLRMKSMRKIMSCQIRVKKRILSKLHRKLACICTVKESRGNWEKGVYEERERHWMTWKVKEVLLINAFNPTKINLRLAEF